MHFSTTFLASLPLLLATGVFGTEYPTEISPLSLSSRVGTPIKRSVSSVLDRRQSCTGTCQFCFGDTYLDCPDDSSLCYDPADGAPSDDCISSGGGTPTGPPSSGETETCNGGGSCVICFGAGYLDCPIGADLDCYDPAVYSESFGCYDEAAPPATSSASSSSQCETLYGPGNIPCASGSCYNPDVGESCCDDGSYCTAGRECALDGSTYICNASDDISPNISSSRASSTGSPSVPSGVISSATAGFTEESTSTSRTPRSESSSRAAPTPTRSSSSASDQGAASTNGLGPEGAASLMGEKSTGIVAALAAGVMALLGLF